jgi:predicted NBD/HSP70 family sugar kinase
MARQQTRIIDSKNLSDHETKNLMILETIRRRGPIARADVARFIELNNVTVTSYVDQYLKKKLVQEAGTDISTGGRKPTLVDLDARMAYAIGVGLNASHMIAVLCNLKGVVTHKIKVNRDHHSAGNLISAMSQVVEKLIADSKVDIKKVHGIGFGVPGIVNSNNGTVRWPRGLLTEDLSVSGSISNQIYEKFKLPVILDNDANTAVFAEQWSTVSGLNVDSAVYMYSGSGCGLLINKQIYRGVNGAAGEFLFDLTREDPVAWLGAAMESGGWGLDLGMTMRAKHELKDHADSKLNTACGGKVENIDLAMIVDAAQQGDHFAKSILVEAGDVLGHKATWIVNLLNPEVLIIGGGVESAGVIFMDAIRQRIKETAIPEATERLKVVPSELGEDAVPIGAAALVIQNYFISH